MLTKSCATSRNSLLHPTASATEQLRYAPLGLDWQKRRATQGRVTWPQNLLARYARSECSQSHILLHAAVNGRRIQRTNVTSLWTCRVTPILLGEMSYLGTRKKHRNAGNTTNYSKSMHLLKVSKLTTSCAHRNPGLGDLQSRHAQFSNGSHMPYSWKQRILAFCACRRGVGCRKVLWQLSVPLHEWHAALGSCIFLVQGTQMALRWFVTLLCVLQSPHHIVVAQTKLSYASMDMKRSQTQVLACM